MNHKKGIIAVLFYLSGLLVLFSYIGLVAYLCVTGHALAAFSTLLIGCLSPFFVLVYLDGAKK